MIERDELVGRLRTIGLPSARNAADQIDQDGRKIERLTAENARLRAALVPFASASDDYCDDWMENDYSPRWAEFFTCGDFRRARAALNGEGET
jgi:hypothetical protein